MALVENLLGLEALLYQRSSTVIFLLGQQHLGILLNQIGVRFVNRLLRPADLGLRLFERGGEIPGVHARDALGRLLPDRLRRP